MRLSLPDTEKRNTICTRVAEIIGGTFKTKFDAIKDPDRYLALLAAKNDDLSKLDLKDADGRKAKIKSLVDALEAAQKKD